MSEASPMYAAQWRLGYPFGDAGRAQLTLATIDRIVAQRRHGYVRWDFCHETYPITLRDLSAPDSGRVKAWRKLAAKGTLPPVLLYWVSGLDAHLVLDGHDRLLAASLDRAPIAALELVALGESTAASPYVQEKVMAGVGQALEMSEQARKNAEEARLARRLHHYGVTDANRVLLDAFSPERAAAPTRAWPLLGGRPRWLEEVRGELARQGILESYLLDEA